MRNIILSFLFFLGDVHISRLLGADLPAVLAKVDLWAKRDRPQHLTAPDLEAVCKWILGVLHVVRTRYVPVTASDLVEVGHSIDQLVDKLLETLEKLPASHYTNILWGELVKKEALPIHVRGFLYAQVSGLTGEGKTPDT
jgi:hypothetical protein